MALDELDEATAFPGWDLDIGNLPKSLEEGPQLILCHVSGQAPDKHGGVIRIGELVHWLRLTVVAHGWVAHGIHTTHLTLALARHTAHTPRPTTSSFVLGRCCRNAHGTIAAIHTLHLGQCTLLVSFVGEADESIPT